MDSEAEDSENTFNILIATDIHLGYAESNPYRENDTFDTFKEILEISIKENVDFILLGGDLFHESRPSPYAINKCMELIRRYCLGDRPVSVEFLSDPSSNFQGKLNSTVNYEDPNMNVSMPIFTIHGNHDDPTGKRHVSAVDLLAAAGLVNYFGRVDDITKVTVNPVLLQKGTSRLALYGLSHIPDQRLARLFLDKKVTFKTPEKTDDWFNLMVLHQNRANRGNKNYIAESFIPDFMDLVMWGHEHDCHIAPEYGADASCYVTQPGSTVATSLAEGESGRKHVGVLKIRGNEFIINPVELKTVRPFIFRSILLERSSSDFKQTPADKAKTIIKQNFEEMLEEARAMRGDSPMLPLLRLVARYEDEKQVFNAIRFGQDFVNLVVNPTDMLKFRAAAKKESNRSRKALISEDNSEAGIADTVEDLVAEYVSREKTPLQVLSISGLNASVVKYVRSNYSLAPKDLIEHQKKTILSKFRELKPTENRFSEVLENLRLARQPENLDNLFENSNQGPHVSDSNESIDISDDEVVFNPSSSVASSANTRGRRVRGARTTRRRGRNT